MEVEQALREAQADALHWERRYHELLAWLEEMRHQAGEELRALHASEATLRLLLESVQDYAIFTLDAEARVTSWNEGARRLDVSDDGQGFELAGESRTTSPNGHGPPRIGQYMQLLGGRMEVASASAQGTRVTLYVPVHAREERNP